MTFQFLFLLLNVRMQIDAGLQQIELSIIDDVLNKDELQDLTKVMIMMDNTWNLGL